MEKKKKPLYRKLGKSKAYCEEIRCMKDLQYKYNRHTKRDSSGNREGMVPKGVKVVSQNSHYHGYDYTPAIRYLYRQIGKNWKRIWYDMEERLPKDVDLQKDLGIDREVHPGYAYDSFPEVQRLGECSFWKAFKIDDQGKLQFVDPEYTVEDLKKALTGKTWKGLTWTFEGERIEKEEEEA